MAWKAPGEHLLGVVVPQLVLISNVVSGVPGNGKACETMAGPWNVPIRTALQIHCVSSGAAEPAVGLPQGCLFTLGTGTAMNP